MRAIAAFQRSTKIFAGGEWSSQNARSPISRARYEELVALHLTNRVRLRECLTTQGYVVLALDGLQPDVGHARLMGVT